MLSSVYMFMEVWIIFTHFKVAGLPNKQCGKLYFVLLNQANICFLLMY